MWVWERERQRERSSQDARGRDFASAKYYNPECGHVGDGEQQPTVFVQQHQSFVFPVRVIQRLVEEKRRSRSGFLLFEWTCDTLCDVLWPLGSLVLPHDSVSMTVTVIWIWTTLCPEYVMFR